jgi:Alginate export
MIKKTHQRIALLLFTVSTLDATAQFLPPQPAVQPLATPLWTINGQLRTRTEMRQGLGTPYPKNSWPASFTSQRTNINIGYRWDKVNFNVDMRDVRVWGQDASSISNADGSKLFLHQAWADIVLGTTADTNARLKIFDNLSLKVGRQELVYDDVRLLGNLDWLQQGRRHDAAVLKILKKGYDIHAGFAMNQNSDAFGVIGNQYTPGNTNTANVNGLIVTAPGVVLASTQTGKNGAVTALTPAQAFNGAPPSTNGQLNQYKFFQYLYATRKFNQTKVSILAFKDDFQKYKDFSRNYFVNPKLNAAGTAVTTDTLIAKGRDYNTGNGLNTRMTFGGQFSTQKGNVSSLKAVVNGGGYYQTGRLSDRAGVGKYINAYHAFIYASFSRKKFSAGPGFEYLSGNSTNYSQTSATAVNGGAEIVSNQNNRFDPLYGTPHRWWGYMDYFYVGTGSPKTGLQDLYLRLKYDANANFNILLDVHNFSSASQVRYKATGKTTFEKVSKNYGYEVDLVANYQFNRFCNIELGGSVFAQEKALSIVKGFSPESREKVNKWAYLMLSIRPDFLFQKPTPITE